MENYKIFNQLIKSFRNLNESNINEKEVVGTFRDIKLKPKIISNKLNNNLKLEISICDNDKCFEIKNLPEFYNRFLNKENYKYSSGLEFIHVKESFNKQSIPLLEYVLKYAEIIKYANEASNGYEYYTNRLGENAISVSNTGMDELFETLKGMEVLVETEDNIEKIEFINCEPDINFELKKKNNLEYIFTTNIELNKYKIFSGKEYKYLWIDKKIYKCTKKYSATILTLLEIYKKNFIQDIIFSEKQLSSFFAIVEPNIKGHIKISKKDYEKISKYIPKQLVAKMFLDYNNQNNIIADIKFNYENIEINPLELTENKNIARNEVKEAMLIDMLVKSGFMLDKENSRLILAEDDKIYKFLTDDMEIYMKNFEVLATDNFKAKQISKPENTSIGVRIENKLLNIDFNDLDIDEKELQEVMKKYRLKKKYYRLKNGSFIQLENNKKLEFINNITKDIDINYSEIDNNNIKIPLYRSFYLEKILEKNSSINVIKNDEYRIFVDGLEKNTLNNDIKLPNRLKVNLRTYQKVGYTWLKTLDKYGLGGILADDMGLGKTVQLLSVVCSYVENTKKRKPTIVICPSSLMLNWQSEIEKFTNNLSSLVIHGNLEERKNRIKEIPKFDMVITSYELLKRDIEEYKRYDYEFKYIVADEAQYIKNNSTKNAKAIKEIKSETKYALTGTPIENSLSELWSIFDFIMPGYLFSYKKFKELYETDIVKENDERALLKLKELISPFILRRIKKEVLTELPDKTITTLNSQMVKEQRDIYMSYLIKAKKNVEEELQENGIEKSQIKILALLTRLRQICCHPSLFISNYKGESGKLNQCIEILKDAISSGHKVLLFSVYTSMFEIIEKRLKEEKIDYLKLTGQTNVSDRLNLVDEFNEDKDVKVFLVSLKAGGTGLNLTGADVVIHYDPWWNISAENQATDRTYRIGQKRNVQVYKLITKDSIEEKIYDLQKRKEMLIDNMLSTNQTFISKLSKEDIMRLFE